jgi:hypothetical protein
VPDVKTNAIMPKGETNGLSAIASELVAEGKGETPHRLRAVIAIIDCRRVSIDADSKDEVATVRFRRVEVLLPGDLPEAEKLIRRALEKRSGLATLPLELETELEETFRDMTIDPDHPGSDPDEQAGPGGGDAEEGGEGEAG